MKKNSFIAFLFCVLTIASFCDEIRYDSFESINEVIEFETSCISNIPSYDYESLSDAYASRGESFLICNRYEKALEDFLFAYDLATLVHDGNIANQLAFRSLLGQAIVYGNLEMMEKFDDTVWSLKHIIYTNRCADCQKNAPEASRLIQTISYVQKCQDVPLIGPDQISTQDCMDLVNNTESLCYLLIGAAVPRVQSALTFTINQLAREARNCCRAGGLWKGCFQKLANKYHQWNQKWKVFGIPPDPAWDD